MKRLIFAIMIFFTLLLTACSASSTSMPVSPASAILSMDTQLAFGTLKLAGTAQDITPEQAKQLVVYWRVYKELSQSDTAAQAEVDGLITQIQETMTADQLQSITDMQLTQQDISTAMEGRTAANGSDSNAISLSSGWSMPEGGPPADITGASPVSNADQSQVGQPAPDSGRLTTVPSALVEVVIQFLQQKISV